MKSYVILLTCTQTGKWHRQFNTVFLNSYFKCLVKCTQPLTPIPPLFFFTWYCFLLLVSTLHPPPPNHPPPLTLNSPTGGFLYLWVCPGTPSSLAGSASPPPDPVGGAHTSRRSRSPGCCFCRLPCSQCVATRCKAQTANSMFILLVSICYKLLLQIYFNYAFLNNYKK